MYSLDISWFTPTMAIKDLISNLNYSNRIFINNLKKFEVEPFIDVGSYHLFLFGTNAL